MFMRISFDDRNQISGISPGLLPVGGVILDWSPDRSSRQPGSLTISLACTRPSCTAGCLPGPALLTLARTEWLLRAQA